MAVDGDLIRKNPFGFELASVVVNDSVTREAITREEERKFLKFIQDDPHFCRYYEGMGHVDIGVTLNTYTHVNFEDAKAEVARLNKAI